MMSFMAVRVSILFMSTLDLWGSVEGVTGTTQQTIVWGWNVELRWRRAAVSLLAAFVEVWRILILFCSGGLAYTWQWRIGYKLQFTFFLQCLLSKLQVLLLMVVFVVTISVANWYILHKFSGEGKYPFLVGTDIFPHCLPTVSAEVLSFWSII